MTSLPDSFTANDVADSFEELREKNSREFQSRSLLETWKLMRQARAIRLIRDRLASISIPKLSAEMNVSQKEIRKLLSSEFDINDRIRSLGLERLREFRLWQGREDGIES